MRSSIKDFCDGPIPINGIPSFPSWHTLKWTGPIFTSLFYIFTYFLHAFTYHFFCLSNLKHGLKHLGLCNWSTVIGKFYLKYLLPLFWNPPPFSKYANPKVFYKLQCLTGPSKYCKRKPTTLRKCTY